MSSKRFDAFFGFNQQILGYKSIEDRFLYIRKISEDPGSSFYPLFPEIIMEQCPPRGFNTIQGIVFNIECSLMEKIDFIPQIIERIGVYQFQTDSVGSFMSLMKELLGSIYIPNKFTNRVVKMFKLFLEGKRDDFVTNSDLDSLLSHLPGGWTDRIGKSFLGKSTSDIQNKASGYFLRFLLLLYWEVFELIFTRRRRLFDNGYTVEYSMKLYKELMMKKKKITTIIQAPMPGQVPIEMRLRNANVKLEINNEHEITVESAIAGSEDVDVTETVVRKLNRRSRRLLSKVGTRNIEMPVKEEPESRVDDSQSEEVRAQSKKDKNNRRRSNEESKSEPGVTNSGIVKLVRIDEDEILQKKRRKTVDMRTTDLPEAILSTPIVPNMPLPQNANTLVKEEIMVPNPEEDVRLPVETNCLSFSGMTEEDEELLWKKTWWDIRFIALVKDISNPGKSFWELVASHSEELSVTYFSICSHFPGDSTTSINEAFSEFYGSAKNTFHLIPILASDSFRSDVEYDAEKMVEFLKKLVRKALKSLKMSDIFINELGSFVINNQYDEYPGQIPELQKFTSICKTIKYSEAVQDEMCLFFTPIVPEFRALFAGSLAVFVLKFFEATKNLLFEPERFGNKWRFSLERYKALKTKYAFQVGKTAEVVAEVKKLKVDRSSVGIANGQNGCLVIAGKNDELVGTQKVGSEKAVEAESTTKIRRRSGKMSVVEAPIIMNAFDVEEADIATDNAEKVVSKIVEKPRKSSSVPITMDDEMVAGKQVDMHDVDPDLVIVYVKLNKKQKRSVKVETRAADFRSFELNDVDTDSTIPKKKRRSVSDELNNRKTGANLHLENEQLGNEENKIMRNATCGEGGKLVKNGRENDYSINGKSPETVDGAPGFENSVKKSIEELKNVLKDPKLTNKVKILMISLISSNQLLEMKLSEVNAKNESASSSK